MLNVKLIRIDDINVKYEIDNITKLSFVKGFRAKYATFFCLVFPRGVASPAI